MISMMGMTKVVRKPELFASPVSSRVRMAAAIVRADGVGVVAGGAADKVAAAAGSKELPAAVRRAGVVRAAADQLHRAEIRVVVRVPVAAVADRAADRAHPATAAGVAKFLINFATVLQTRNFSAPSADGETRFPALRNLDLQQVLPKIC
jgi:hypothetical protein